MNGETPLHLACKNGNIQLVEMLMERSDELNIDFNEKTGNNYTQPYECSMSAFHLVCKFGKSDMVKMFIEKSINLK